MASMHEVPFEIHSNIRFGLIGAGERGRGLLNDLLACQGLEVKAIADTNQQNIDLSTKQVIDARQQKPDIFIGHNAWQYLLEKDLDLVYIATPWNTHTQFAVAAMQAGKHVGVEVPAAVTLKECWQLVEVSEQTQRHCVMLENCYYGYWEMLIKNMAKAGLFGTITHAECAYIHDMRHELFADRSEGLWRRLPHITRDSNHYPTHGLGPVAKILGIGSEDAFDYLVSMSSLSAGLKEYSKLNIPSDDPRQQETYICGDMNTSLIRTKLGRTIVLQHGVTNPRPYDRNFLIGGTKGTFRDLPPRLYLDDAGKREEWLDLDNYKEQWEDSLWKKYGDQARKSGGHGGMDFILNYRLIQLMLQGLPPDMDVYDAAEWSVPGPLSEQSVRQKSAAILFPDFRNKK